MLTHGPGLDVTRQLSVFTGFSSPLGLSPSWHCLRKWVILLPQSSVFLSAFPGDKKVGTVYFCALS